eukprot:COSAG06_NODE_114_length_23375_cov_20.304219_7_plen_79_part_00
MSLSLGLSSCQTRPDHCDGIAIALQCRQDDKNGTRNHLVDLLCDHKDVGKALLYRSTRGSAPFIFKNGHFTKTGSGQT